MTRDQADLAVSDQAPELAVRSRLDEVLRQAAITALR
jgi:hypothetical protein